MTKSIPTGRDTPDPKINRKGPPQQPAARSIQSYINRGVPAPQPAGPKSISRQIEREAAKRPNGSR
jgi:hypothetical protein